MMNHKPFTLGWWLHIHRLAVIRHYYWTRMSSKSWGHDTNDRLRYSCLANRYEYLTHWIEKRIVNKYEKKLDIDQDNRYLINNKHIINK